jgi:hypothetical protein
MPPAIRCRIGQAAAWPPNAVMTNTVPPIHMLFFLEAAILSCTRSFAAARLRSCRCPSWARS